MSTADLPDDDATPAEPTGAGPREGRPTGAEPTAPTEAVPTEAAPTEAAPTEAAPTEAAPTEAAPTEAELERTAVPATLRRAPRYRAFALAGVLVGLVLAIVAVAIAGPAREGAPLGTASVLGLLAVILGGFGALLGTGVAVLVDRRSVRRGRRAARPDDDAPSSSA